MLQSELDVWVRFRPSDYTLAEQGISTTHAKHDPALVGRIVESYRKSFAIYGKDQQTWYYWLGQYKSGEHALLLNGSSDDCETLLQDPSASLLHYGFDEICRQEFELKHGISHIISTADWIYDLLLRTAEAVGSYPLQYPELLRGTAVSIPSIDQLLSLLDRAFGFHIDFPNPFANELGLRTPRGIASFRAVQSLFQAWRIHDVLKGRDGSRVVEIGGGLGRTAYYAKKMGIENYTIVDIPLTAVAQANYLGRVLGEDKLTCFGEYKNDTGIVLRSPADFLEAADNYDLIVNFDGITEQARSSATEYWNFAQKAGTPFLSVNHEVHDVTFRSLYKADMLAGRIEIQRHPYWLRQGYVDELVRFCR